MNDAESKIEDQYNAFDDHIAGLDPFLNDLLSICKKHGINNTELNFVNELFQKGYMPALDKGGLWRNTKLTSFGMC